MPWRTKQRKHKTPKAKTERGPSNQVGKNWSKFEKKAFRSKLLEVCKTRTKKSSLDMLNFYLASSARDMVTDNDNSTTCRSKVKARSLKLNKKMNDLSKTMAPANKRLKILRPKKNKNSSFAMGNKTTETQDPKCIKLNMNDVTRKIKNKQI